MRPLTALLGVPLGWLALRRLVLAGAALLPPRPVASGSGLPSLAVVVPARDEVPVLDDLLAAFDALEYPGGRLSFVLVSDGSVDGTAERFAAWADGRADTLVIVEPEPRGKAAALRRGVEASDSELVAVLDADVLPRPDALRLLAAALAEPGIAVAAGRLEPVNARASAVARYRTLELWVRELVVSAGQDRLGLYPLPYAAAVYRRDALDAAGGFAALGPGEDTAAALALARAGFGSRFVAEAVAEIRVAETVGELWRQHRRWAQGVFETARPVPSDKLSQGTEGVGTLRRLELATMGAGFLDRLLLAAAVAAAGARLVPRRLPAALVVATGVEVGVALARSGAGPEWPRFAAAAVLFPLDVAAAVAGMAERLVRRRAEWSR